MQDQIEDGLPWGGIHHIALATHDIEETLRFYHQVLGMQVSDMYPSRAGRGRHGIVLVKPTDSETLGLHFFERAGLTPPTQPATLESSSSNAGLLHIALRLPNTATADILRARLATHQVSITEIVELGSFVFSDNNALLLEVTWPQK
jgi:catechol 2,3-dioxygenase-like lactoylglutathione lyase family enzyme